MRPPLRRFWDRVEKTDTCWLWTGPLKPTGYGTQVSVRGVLYSPHRYAWIETNGSIPDGLQIDHKCRNRRCVRPSHLRVVNQRTNVLCGEGFAAQNARKKRCPRGHAYVVRKNGRMGLQRQCLICRRKRALERYHRLRALALAAGSPSLFDILETKQKNVG